MKLHILEDGVLRPFGVPIKEAARIIGISPRAVWHYVATGELVTRRIGGRRIVLLSSIEAFMRKDHAPPKK